MLSQDNAISLPPDTQPKCTNRQRFRVNRRMFLKFGATLATALSVPTLTNCMPVQPPPNTHSMPTAPTGPAQVLADQTLVVQVAPVPVWVKSLNRTEPREVRTYNRQVPGPTIRIRRGSEGGQLKIKLINQLPPNPADALGNNCPADLNAKEHGVNTTNIHTHGLHVSPHLDQSQQFDADNVFIAVLPENEEPPANCGHEVAWRKGEVQYVYDIAKEHPPGTHWYHAHKHGSTARQVGRGLFGALIIEEEPDETWPYIAAAKEQILFVHAISIQDVMHGQGGDVAIRNADGEVFPQIVLQPGEVQRWRLINASPSHDHFIGLQLKELGARAEDLEFYLIAYDGIMLPKREPVDLSNSKEDPTLNWAGLAPGNRADFLVRAKPSAKAGELVMASRDFEESPTQRQAASDLMNIKIEGAPKESEWPDDATLPGYGKGLPDLKLNETVPRRVIKFELVAGTFDKFTINSALYNGHVTESMTLDTVEEWTLENYTDKVHPIHIHVNPFFVTHINGQKLEDNDVRRRWQDTIAVPTKLTATQPGSITFRTKFTDYTGKFVIHCHNLKHEDMGMMQAVEVVPA